VTGPRIVVLGVALVALVVALVVGVAWQTLNDLFKGDRAPKSAKPVRRSTPRLGVTNRSTPERTRLRPYSPEILAVVLVALAAGLWLSRLLG